MVTQAAVWVRCFSVPNTVVVGSRPRPRRVQGAVSYTHLDVYKRQVEGGTIRAGFIAGGLLLVVYAMLGHAGAETGTVDVYKRQILYSVDRSKEKVFRQKETGGVPYGLQLQWLRSRLHLSLIHI